MYVKFLSTLIVLPAALAAIPAFAADDPPITLSATLNGANEVDAQGAGGQGDKDGTGTFSAKIDLSKQQICYTLTWTGIDDPTMAHIHSGAAGKNGPVVIGLPDLDAGEHCQDIDKDRAAPLLSKTGDFYVNIHNGDFPGGAVRGQLTK